MITGEKADKTCLSTEDIEITYDSSKKITPNCKLNTAVDKHRSMKVPIKAKHVTESSDIDRFQNYTFNHISYEMPTIRTNEFS